MSTAHRWLEEWNSEPLPGDMSTEQLFEILISKLKKKRILILIDSLERLLIGDETNGWGEHFIDEWWEKFFLRVLSLETFQSRIIITSQDLPMNLCHTRYQTFLFISIRRIEGIRTRRIIYQKGIKDYS
ncbi:MAG: hypothetical protein OMM_09151 [Candidatus Magnetoglobus multicellularis str. Araruama]|uniref:ATPase AAA-type core domain-containing protein n=1 Tax=Candidatus Magnetoglobus multicellularis str. Araruama TaxID=890399 RepID=A0A1V1P539_9BACT|nr:MAG: hypothetical protein OMM_09151 [Candidatus Magnetoglobus multicellularis str. Araruama]